MGITTYLPAGQVLTVTADAGSAGTLTRLSDLPGGGASLGADSVAASSSVAVGPFSGVTRWDVTSTAGLLAYAIAAPLTEADFGVAASRAGAPSGTGVTAKEYGSGLVHKTLLTLTNLSVAMTDATTAGSHGTQVVYTFPEGAIEFLGGIFNLTTLAGSGGITDTAALVSSLGSAAVGTGDATLTSTEADMIPSTAGTLTGGAGTLKKVGNLVAAAFDGTSSAITANLNLAVPDAGSSADDTVTLNGTIILDWKLTGDN